MVDWKIPAGAAALVVVAAAAAQLTEPAPVPPVYAEPVRPSGPRSAVVWVHEEWSTGVAMATQLGRSCPEGPLLESEVARVRELLAGLGYRVEVRGASASLEDLLTFDLVVAHDGGWGSFLSPHERDAMEAMRLAQVPVVLLGDDAGMRVRNDPEVQSWYGIARVVHNGQMPGTLSIPGAGALRYEKEVDVVALAPGLDVRAWTDHGAPLAWVTPSRTAVLLASVRASDVCPVTSPEGEAALGGLFRELVGAVTR